jgi:sugar phosphate isomerase/epimerase
MGLSRLPALAKAAVDLGCDLLTLCTGTRHATDMWAWHPDNHSPDAWADMVDGLRRASRIARCYGVGVAIEPETANVVCDAESAELALRELGDDAQAVSIVLDGANLYRSPADPRLDTEIIDNAAARLGAHIRVAHAKDIADPEAGSSGNAAAHYTHVAAGTGILPYPYYLSKLSLTPAARAAARRGQRLPLILHGLTEGQVPPSVKFLRDTMRSISGSYRCADAVL